MPVTPEQAQAVTALALACRPHGARHWDAAGVMAAIRKVAHLHLADVIRAAVNAAEERELHTPGAIGNPQAPCWRERNLDRPVAREPFDPGGTCGICGRTEGHCRARDAAAPPEARHEYESIHETRRKAARRKPMSHEPHSDPAETARGPQIGAEQIAEVLAEEPIDVGWYAYSGGSQTMIFHLRETGQWSAHFDNGSGADCAWGYIEQALGAWDLVRIDPPTIQQAKAEGAREALTETRDAWQWGAWIEAPVGGGSAIQQKLTHGQFVTDWLTDRIGGASCGCRHPLVAGCDHDDPAARIVREAKP